MRLEVDGVGHRFGETEVFRDVTFTLGRGDMLAVLGPSGSGKSTLLSILAGSITPTWGRVIRQDAHRVGWVFQNPHGVSQRTSLEHVVLPLLARGMTRPAAEVEATDILRSFNLDHLSRSLFRSLSGGEAQRLMLARALASAPDLLLVDEPTAQLDPSSANAVIQVLGKLQDRGVMVIVATHDARVSEACVRSLRMGQP